MTVRDILDPELGVTVEEWRSGEPGEVPGTVQIHDEVIGAIAGVAAREIDGVVSLGSNSIRRAVSERLGSAQRRARGVGVEAGSRETILDIALTVSYGYSIPQVCADVRQNVANRVSDMCGLTAKEVNISVTSIQFSDSLTARVE
jgi:uncharacterized alkaline shock family protein YloU